MGLVVALARPEAAAVGHHHVDELGRGLGLVLLDRSQPDAYAPFERDREVARGQLELLLEVRRIARGADHHHHLFRGLHREREAAVGAGGPLRLGRAAEQAREGRSRERSARLLILKGLKYFKIRDPNGGFWGLRFSGGSDE